jgi:hypothetical protein
LRSAQHICIPHQRGGKPYGKEKGTDKEKNTDEEENPNEEKSTGKEAERGKVHWEGRSCSSDQASFSD